MTTLTQYIAFLDQLYSLVEGDYQLGPYIKATLRKGSNDNTDFTICSIRIPLNIEEIIQRIMDLPHSFTTYTLQSMEYQIEHIHRRKGLMALPTVFASTSTETKLFKDLGQYITPVPNQMESIIDMNIVLRYHLITIKGSVMVYRDGIIDHFGYDATNESYYHQLSHHTMINTADLTGAKKRDIYFTSKPWMEYAIQEVHKLVSVDREYSFSEKYKIVRFLTNWLVENLAELVGQYIW